MSSRDTYIAFAAGILTGVIGTTAVNLLMARQRGPKPAASAQAQSGSADSSATPPPAGQAAHETPPPPSGDDDLDGGPSDAAVAVLADGGVVPLTIADPAHVDPIDLFPQVKALVGKIEKRARLARIVVPSIQQDGTVDVSKDRGIDYKFEYAYTEPGQPVAKSVYKGRINVQATASGLKATQAAALAQEPILEHPLNDPKCALKKAWAAVAETSVPGASAAKVSFDWDTRVKTGVWRFGFGSRAVGDRVVDGVSCALHSGTPPSPTAAPAPPKPPKKKK